MSDIGNRWELFAKEFYCDGSLRDIYVLNTELQHWDAAARFIEGRYMLEFAGGWTGSQFPSGVARLFPKAADDPPTGLTIEVGSVRVVCHFFTIDEIEFDVNPADVGDVSSLADLFGFMSGLAEAVGKDVLLTPENCRDIPIFRFRPGVDSVCHVAFGGFR
jgi:hypothetical protein